MIAAIVSGPSRSTSTRRAAWFVAIVCLAVVSPTSARQRGDKESKDGDRPRLSLKAQPPMVVSNARVVLTAELVGGADDNEEFYCPAIEWDWGDDTKSESTIDCEPYETGKSSIRRRFTVEHRFNRAGSYKIYFKLKRRDKVIAAATTNVQVRPGARDFEP